MTPPDTRRGRLAADRSRRAEPRPADLGRFLSLMSEIERELHCRDQWEPVAPEPAAFESRLPFCCDSMRFTQWLQWVFIPHTRALAEAGGPMPEASGIRPMAEEALRDCDWDIVPLLILLDRFDRLIRRGCT